MIHRISVIDSHTEGEPTRVVIAGGPDLDGGSVAAQRDVFRAKFDWFRSAVVNEPRGSDPMVGALIVPASSARAICGVIFFNNVGVLNACGHGTIGLARTLVHLGKIRAGRHVIETAVGEVAVEIAADGGISIDNVASHRHAKDVAVSFSWEGKTRTVRGDVAWGGNWFFLVSEHGQELSMRNIEGLTSFTWAIREGLERAGIKGDPASGGTGLIDHIELFAPASRADCHSRNFVLCPGKAYDRSPCGTGTSAKLACLFADGKIKEGETWRQESIIGSAFSGRVAVREGKIVPTISGGAWITGEATLLLDETDPFVHGIRIT